MPIFRINGQLHYFAHVPKCGGSSIERYLIERFGPLGFHQPKRNLVPPEEMWDRSAAQHVPVFALDRLIPPDWFASSFAVVRNPLSRLISAFFFGRDRMGNIPATAEFNSWFQEASGWIKQRPLSHGSHFLPQSALVPAKARIFRFEDEMSLIVPHLDRLAGNRRGPRALPVYNIGLWRATEPPPVPTEATLALVAAFYAEDYDRFGYAPPVPGVAIDALMSLPSTAARPAPPRQKFLTRLQSQLMKRAGM